MENDKLFEPVLRRDSIFSGKYIHLQSLEVRHPNGRSGSREVVQVPNAAAVLPIDERGDVYLVRQSRPAMDGVFLEIPAGLVDPGETPAQTALRECEEEIRLRPLSMAVVLTYAHAEGYSTGMTTLFVGTDLRPAEDAQPDESEFLEIVKMSFDELIERVRLNEIRDSKTIISALVWQNRDRHPDWLDFDRPFS